MSHQYLASGCHIGPLNHLCKTNFSLYVGCRMNKGNKLSLKDKTKT